MIKVEMTVREMLNIIALQGTSGDLAAAKRLLRELTSLGCEGYLS